MTIQLLAQCTKYVPMQNKITRGTCFRFTRLRGLHPSEYYTTRRRRRPWRVGLVGVQKTGESCWACDDDDDVDDGCAVLVLSVKAYNTRNELHNVFV